MIEFLTTALELALIGALILGVVYGADKLPHLRAWVKEVSTKPKGKKKTEPAPPGGPQGSGRGKYGTVRGNLSFFAKAFALPIIPWVFWLVLDVFFDFPDWLDALLTGFVGTLSMGLALVVVVFLVAYPPFAKYFKWELVRTNGPDGMPVTIETAPERWLEPWSYAVPEGKLVTRVGDGDAVIDYTMRQGDYEIAYDLEEGPFIPWKERYAIKDAEGSPSDVKVYSIWHWYHMKASGGLIFGGFAWYTKLYTYELDIVKAEIGTNGRVKLQIYPKSRSDHIRVRPFAWAVVVDVFTKDKYRVSIIITFELRCVNPDKTLFGKDRWERLFSQEVSGKAMQAASTITVFQLLEGDTANDARNEVAVAIETLTESVRQDLGIEIRKTQVPGYLEVGTTKEQQDALTAEAVAIQQAKVTVIAGQAEATSEAAVVRERGVATEASKYGVEVSLHQALETLNAKGGSVIANLGTGGDDMSKAILPQLKQITHLLEAR